MAKEPLHFYEPSLTGLDCGLSFGKELLKHLPDSIYNFREKLDVGKKYGKIKGILWHQGGTDAATAKTIEIYDAQLKKLFILFRNETENKSLPIFIGELGTFSETDDNWQAINNKIRNYIATDSNAYVIKTKDLSHKGDRVHFNSEGQRLMGQRFAKEFINRQK